MQLNNIWRLSPLTLIRLSTAVISLLISIWAYHASSIINADGILYIYTIDAFKAGGIAATESFYNWPFFPIITAWLSDFSGWNTELSVKALNSILFVLLTDALVLLSYKALPNRRQVAIAAVLVLAFYSLNNYRDFIIRDIGYWAFASYALYQFALYLEHQKIEQAIFWQLLMLVAFLFRIEAAIFLATVPLYVFTCNHFQNKFRSTLNLYSISIISFIIAIPVFLFHPETSSAFSKMKQILLYLDPSVILSEINHSTDILQKEILHPAANEHAFRVLVFGLTLTVLWELFAGVSIPYLVLLAMALMTLKRFQGSSQQRFFIFIVLINILILSVFAIKSQLITTRYCVLGLLFIILALLPTLTTYIHQQIDRKQKKTLAIIVFIIFASLADTLITTKAKPHLKNVPAWAAQNLPDDAKVFTTHFRVEYYFNQYRGDGTKVNYSREPEGISEYDYLITYSKNDEKIPFSEIKDITLELIKEQGNSDNRVSIYAIKH